MTSDIFSIGRTGLHTAKKRLSTTSHNIANANTEGYSRQRVLSEAHKPIGEGNYVVGRGVQIKSIKRIHDAMIEKKHNTALAQKEYHDERVYQLQQVEDLFNEIHSEGFSKILNRFFNSFRELSTQPENDTVRGIVRENAKIVVDDFRRAREHLNDIVHTMDQRLEASVKDINTIMSNIAQLNLKVVEIEGSGGETGDIRDQRDLAIKNLSEYFKIHTYEDDQGNYIVNAKGVGTLVSGGSPVELTTGRFLDEESGEHRLDIFFRGRKTQAVSKGFREGKIKGIVQTRNNEVYKMQQQLDSLAFDIAHLTNAIHRRGYTNKEIPTDKNGNLLPHNDPYTNIDFFDIPDERKGAANVIDLSKAVKDDVNNIATSLLPNSPGDNRIAIAISKLQHEKVLAQGTSTFEESFLKSISEVGLAAGKEKIDLEQSSGILAQLRTLKERISGVSIDEETSDMLRFQHTYDASARLIRAADEMFDSVLEMSR